LPFVDMSERKDHEYSLNSLSASNVRRVQALARIARIYINFADERK
jgi:hypothetical protein